MSMSMTSYTSQTTCGIKVRTRASHVSLETKDKQKDLALLSLGKAHHLQAPRRGVLASPS